MALILKHSRHSASISPLAVNNGIEVVAGKAGLGGSLIRNTTITGAFGIALSNANASWAVGAAVSAVHKIYGSNVLTNPVNGTAAGLFQTRSTPTVDISAANVYGSAASLELNLAAAKVTVPDSFNVTGHVAHLILRNSLAKSTGEISASRSVLNIYDAVLAAVVAMHCIKSPEISGAGAVIDELIGLHIHAQKSAAATEAYGIKQEGADDINYFAGIVTLAKGLKYVAEAAGITTVIIPAGTIITAVDVVDPASITLRIGTTLAGEEILPDTVLPIGGSPISLLYKNNTGADQTIYFGGVTVASVITLIKAIV